MVVEAIHLALVVAVGQAVFSVLAILVKQVNLDRKVEQVVVVDLQAVLQAEKAVEVVAEVEVVAQVVVEVEVAVV